MYVRNHDVTLRNECVTAKCKFYWILSEYSNFMNNNK